MVRTRSVEDSSDSTSLLQASVLVLISHERADFCGRFWQGHLLPYAQEANSALYANLAKPSFARFYAKSLIPRLGT